MIHCPTFLLIIWHFSIFTCDAQLSFNYTSFDLSTKGILYDGDAACSDHRIQLTLNQNRSTGRAMHSEAMQLQDESGSVADFSTYFSFKINSEGRSDHSDGMAFFIAPVGFAMPSIQEGAGLGLVSGDKILNSSLNQFVAVEFDTYENDWDPSYDYVGININSMASVKNGSWSSGIPYGRTNEAWISYNSSAKNLTVLFTSFSENQTSIKSLWCEVDLGKYLPEKVVFGFSAATGRHLWEIHRIHLWSFSSSVRNNPVNSKPPETSPRIIESLRPKKKNIKLLVTGLVVGTLACILLKCKYQ